MAGTNTTSTGNKSADSNKTPTYKRVLAIIGVVILVGMYVVLLIEALLGSPDTFNIFIGCVAATVAMPILLWIIIWAVGAFTGRHTVASLDALSSNKQHDKYGNVIPEGEIDTIVFDIGGVLADFAWREFLANKGFDGEMVERIGRASVNTPEWNEIDRGVLTLDEIIDSFVKNDPEIEKEIRRGFDDFKDIVTRREKSIPWIKKIQRSGYKVLVLSNFSKEAYEQCPEAMDFLSVVDGGILSYRDKVTKPDPAIYNLLAERYDLTPEKTVFIDDTPKNIDAAKSLGWHGIVFKSYEQVENDLFELGVRY